MCVLFQPSKVEGKYTSIYLSQLNILHSAKPIDQQIELERAAVKDPITMRDLS